MSAPVLSVERVSSRPGGVNVVVVDFQPLAAPQLLASALAAVGDDRLDIRRIDAVRDLVRAGSYLSVADLAYSYAPLLGRVDCVIGYCSACVLAAAVATALAEPGVARPPVIFVNPTWPTVRQAVDDFAAFLARLGAPSPTAVREWSGGGAPAYARMTLGLRAALADLAAADGIDADEVALLEAELLSRFGGWLGFLLASAEVPCVNGSRAAGADRTVRAAQGDRLDGATVAETVATIHDLVSRKGDRQ
jgi:hypothetical protein